MGLLGMWCTCVVVEGDGVLWGVVLGKNEGGRKEGDKFGKLPVSEYEQVTCWFRVGLLDFGPTATNPERRKPRCPTPDSDLTPPHYVTPSTLPHLDNGIHDVFTEIY